MGQLVAHRLVSAAVRAAQMYGSAAVGRQSPCPTPRSLPSPHADHALARRLAIEAGDLLVGGPGRAHGRRRRRRGRSRTRATVAPTSSSWPSSRHRVDAGDGVLSEEARATHGDETPPRGLAGCGSSTPSTARASSPSRPRTDWAVHVALCIDGVAECGAVALPALGTCFSTADPVSISHRSDPSRRIRGSSSRAPDRRPRPRPCGPPLDGVVVEMGSAGAKTMAILRGRGRLLPALGRPVRVGLGRAGRRRPPPRAARHPASTARRSSTTTPTPTCPTCWSAGPSWPRPRVARRLTADAGGDQDAPLRGRRPRRAPHPRPAPTGATRGPGGCTSSTGGR